MAAAKMRRRRRSRQADSHVVESHRGRNLSLLCSIVLSYLSTGSAFHPSAFQNIQRPRGLETRKFSFNVDPTSRTWSQSPTPEARSGASNTNISGARKKTKPMPITGYDAVAIEEFYDRRPLEVAWRLNLLGFPLLGTCCWVFRWWCTCLEVC